MRIGAIICQTHLHIAGSMAKVERFVLAHSSRCANRHDHITLIPHLCQCLWPHLDIYANNIYVFEYGIMSIIFIVYAYGLAVTDPSQIAHIHRRFGR